MRHALILFTLCLIGCAESPLFTSIGADFKSYVKMFDDLYSGSWPPIEIKFGQPSDASWAGECIQNEDGQKTIIIRETSWNKYCESQKRALIFHELGHCVLGRSHSTDTLSYMYPSELQCAFYDANKGTLDIELFK